MVAGEQRPGSPGSPRNGSGSAEDDDADDVAVLRPFDPRSLVIDPRPPKLPPVPPAFLISLFSLVIFLPLRHLQPTLG